MIDPFDIPLSELRQRRSAKWTRVPPDSLPLWVAEMDVRLADPIRQRLHEAIELSDTGYAGDPTDMITAFCGFAAQRWDWTPDPARCTVFPDLARSGQTVLSALAGDNGQVVITPPVYSSFFAWLTAAGLHAVEVPLADATGALDLDAIGAAFADGVRVMLLCSPHNPTGLVRPAGELAALAELAGAHGAYVVSDEIHAPLTYPGEFFTPFLTVSDAARRVGVALQSASKAWNLAGLKASITVTAEEGPAIPFSEESAWDSGHLGVLAAEAAFRDSVPWLDEVTAGLAHRAEHIAGRLADELPAARFVRPGAGYLGWLDLREVFSEDDPAAVIHERTGLFLTPGPWHGAPGRGHVRLNFATSMPILDDALDRLVSATP